MLSDNDFLQRIGDYFDTGDLAELIRVDVWDFIEAFEDDILARRKALLDYMDCDDGEEDDDSQDER